MKRNEHLFQFNGKQIAEAARGEHEYHERRLDFWKGEQQKAIAIAKEAGVEVNEYDVTGGKRVDVVIDPSVGQRLNECANKIQKHNSAADKFQIEAAAYGTQPERAYELHPDDIVYFRLAGGSRED